MDEAAVTAKFRQAASYAILNVVPGLAAVYTSRARLRSSACTFPDSCVKCGTYQFDGSSNIRVLRVRRFNDKKPAQKVLRRTCLICGYKDDAEVHPELEIKKSSSVDPGQSVVELPAPIEAESRHSRPKSPVASPSFHEALPCPLNVHSTMPGTKCSQHRGKHIVKSGLQELLSRNKGGKVHHPDQAEGGLAAFLSNL
ncbi:hypothetical protein M378DRAFT_22151 [Amanita muscaria Koide BX008]|uniref:Uncharacterized protein n=1 Tax=Amanita muscaria (strain Koide BX008) TaxID=946122 RepID=A0A0C2SX46_AMAMK|nr:hypothetical protein M378DRAFT_22151 [Amanita muscaria Koide BX008]